MLLFISEQRFAKFLTMLTVQNTNLRILKFHVHLHMYGTAEIIDLLFQENIHFTSIQICIQYHQQRTRICLVLSSYETMEMVE